MIGFLIIVWPVSKDLARLNADKISRLSWILWKNMPDVGQIRGRETWHFEWIKSIRKLLKFRIHHLSGKMRTIYSSAFKKPEVVNEVRRLHDNFVLVPADTLSSFVCLFVYSRTSNFSAVWWLSPLPVTGLQNLAYARRSGPLSREGSLSCHTYCDTGPRFVKILLWMSFIFTFYPLLNC
jgi:hypothetical protein